MKAHLLGSTDEALALIRQAREAVPGRHAYTLLQARLHARRGEHDAARALLTAAAVDPETRGQAEEDLSHLADVEKWRAVLPDRPPTARHVPEPPPGAELVPLFREPAPGEHRLEGRLRRLECRPGGDVVVHVRVGSRTRRFTAARFSDIDFITYRPDVGGTIHCGGRVPAAHVYLTWTAPTTPAALDGRVVAVEFLPVVPNGAGSR